MPGKTNDQWWRRKFGELRALAEPVRNVDPAEVYGKDGAWPVIKRVCGSAASSPASGPSTASSPRRSGA